MAWEIGKVLQAEPVAMGGEIAGGRKKRTAIWGMHASPLKDEGQVLDEMAEEQLLELEQQGLEILRRQ